MNSSLSKQRLSVEILIVCGVVLFNGPFRSLSKHGENAFHSNDGLITSLWYSCYNWLKIEKQWSDRMIFTIGTFIAHELPFSILNIWLFMVHHYNWFSKYKIQQDKYPEWDLIKECIIHCLIKHFIIFPIAVYMIYPLMVQYTNVYMVGELPSIWTVIWQLLASFILNETLFFWSHRMLHHRRIYKYIHKQHHTFKATIGIASEFAHPIEDVFSNIVPTLCGPVLLGSHTLVLWFWLGLRIAETVDSHSGYRFPFSPWGYLENADRHDFHHSHNVGMYSGILGFWDWFCGTDQPYVKFRERELQKLSIKDKKIN